MAIDYMEVMGALSAVAGKHPQTTSLLMQTYSLANANTEKAIKIYDEYTRAAATATGTLDQAGIVMQLLALHPEVVPLLTQALASWQSRIPDLIQVLNEFQAASVAAAKT